MVCVVDYLMDRLASLGVEHVFGVPGDYAFPVNDAVTDRADMRWVGCSNELNAAYAADGYARIRGLAVLNTTYGVGELSAMNGIAGAYAEHLPVIHLVGMPGRAVMEAGRLIHHSLGDGQAAPFYEAAGTVSCARAVLDGQNCVAELERVLAAMGRERRPVYIGIPADSAREEVVMEAGTSMPVASPFSPALAPAATVDVGPVVERIMQALRNSRRPCVLPGMLMARFGCHDALGAFLRDSGLPHATMLMDKGLLDEQGPGHVGMYCGHLMEREVAAFVEGADLVLALGVQWTDFNTGGFTADLAPECLISLTPEGVQFGDGSFIAAPLAEVMAALAGQAATIRAPALPGYLGEGLPARQEDEGDDGVIRVHTLHAALMEALGPGDILVGETGTASMGLGFLRLPEGVRFEGQSLWGSIGWATPAAFGMAMADPSRRVVLVTGEGSHQLTIQAVGEFARFGCQPLILVLNNDGYLIERLLCDEGERPYNDVARWDYTLLARGFGGGDWQCERVMTPAMLRQALQAVAASPGRGAYLEVMAPRYDAPPFAVKLGEMAHHPQG